MANQRIDADRAYGDTLREIKLILESTHPTATPGEKIVRIGWALANLPADLRDSVVKEVQKRAVLGWAGGTRPTEF